MIARFSRILEELMRWKDGGLKETSNGTRLVCHVPHVAPEAWLHRVYAGLTDNQIDDMEQKIGVQLPKDLMEFFKAANGINVFSDTISVWGMRTSYERIGDNAIQPYDLITLNQERTRGCPPSWLFFGSYSWDGSKVFFHTDNQLQRVFRSTRRTNEILNEWPDFWTWLTDEVERLEQLFDERGRKYDSSIPTTPQGKPQ